MAARLSNDLDPPAPNRGLRRRPVRPAFEPQPLYLPLEPPPRPPETHEPEEESTPRVIIIPMV